MNRARWILRRTMVLTIATGSTAFAAPPDLDGHGIGGVPILEIEAAIAASPELLDRRSDIDGDLLVTADQVESASLGALGVVAALRRGTDGFATVLPVVSSCYVSCGPAYAADPQILVTYGLDPEEGGGSLQVHTTSASPDQLVNGIFAGRYPRLSVDGSRALASSSAARSFEPGLTVLLERDELGTWSETAMLHPLAYPGDDDVGDGAALGEGWAATGGGPVGPIWTYEEGPDGWARGPDLATPPGTTASDLRALAGSGKLLVVPRSDDDSAGIDAGAVYVYRRAPGSWSGPTALVAPAAAPGDRFGASVDLVGSVLVVGAPGTDVPDGLGDDGAAWVFVDIDGAFEPMGIIEPGGTAGIGLGAGHGASVATDGATVVVDASGGAAASAVVALPWVCRDEDGDGYGSPATAACAEPLRDCDDRDPAVHPGAIELPGNGVDEDCDPSTPVAGCAAIP